MQVKILILVSEILQSTWCPNNVSLKLLWSDIK